MKKLKPFIAGLLFILLSCAPKSPRDAQTNNELQGMASWYGHPFHGRKTASGEAYDMHAMTAAHKTLPFGSLVQVTRRDTGASAVVRINDRGPFKKGRVIDVSLAAAKILGLDRDGLAPVLLKLSPHKQASQTKLRKVFYLQVGSYHEPKHAKAYAEYVGHLQDKSVSLAFLNAQHKVWVGPYFAKHEAQSAQIKLRDQGLPSLILRRS